MNWQKITKTIYSLEVSEEELSVVAGALHCASTTDIVDFIREHRCPCDINTHDRISDVRYDLSEDVNKLVSKY